MAAEHAEHRGTSAHDRLSELLQPQAGTALVHSLHHSEQEDAQQPWDQAEGTESDCIGVEYHCAWHQCNAADTQTMVCWGLQGMYRSAESKAQQVSESLADQKVEAQKLQERLGAAWQEYKSGMNKLQSTNRQLQALAKRVGNNDAKAQGA